MQPRVPNTKFYVTAPLLWPLVLGLGTLGLDAPALLARTGLSLNALRDPDARFSPEVGLELVRLATQVSGDENLGLHLALLYEPGTFGVLDFLANCAHDLREAIDMLCRYERIHQNGMRTELTVQGDRAWINHYMLHPYPMLRQVSENTLANLIVIGRKLTGIDYTPLEVTFAHAAPRDVREHERLFRCPMRWNAERDAVCIPARMLDAVLRTSNSSLVHTLEQHASVLLAKLSVEGSVQSRVRELICDGLPRGKVSLQALASAMHMNARTLQRRLHDEGTSHGTLLDDLRRKLAEEYLRRADIGTEDLAVLLGFSGSRAFRRAFQRWTGKSPAEFRQSTRRTP